MATCTKWVDVPKGNAAVNVTGPLTVWQYYYKNCSESISIGAEFNLTFTSGGKPLNASVSGLGFTGE